MEEISGTKSHKLILNNRRTGSFTGILDVLSFDVGEILLETELGMLDLKGKDLHVNRLNLEKGEADIEGEIDMITYSKVPEVTGKKDKMKVLTKKRNYIFKNYLSFSLKIISLSYASPSLLFAISSMFGRIFR